MASLPKLTRYLALFITGTCFLSISAQPTLQGYDLYNTKSGLSHNHVITIAQDNDGYIWAGTRNGVCRFDGHEFVSYVAVVDSLNNSLGNAISAIHCQRNRVWIGTRGGLLAFMNTKTGNWQQIKKTVAPGRPAFGICALYSVNETMLYAGTSDGCLLLINPYSQYVKSVKITSHQVRSITSSGADLIIYADKLYRYSKAGLSTVNLQVDLPLWPASAVNRNMLMVNREKKSYLFYDLNTHKIIRAANKNEPNQALNIITATKKHFISTDGNIINVFNLDGSIRNTIHINENELRDKWELINQVFEDRQGNIWIGMDHGLVKIVPSRYRFNHFHTNSKPRKLSHNYVRALYADSNTIWVGTWHGNINKLWIPPGRHDYTATSYPFTKNDGEIIINAITRLKNGTLVAAGPSHLFRLRENVFEPYPFSLEGDLWMIKEDKRGWIWISAQSKEGNRLYVMNEKQVLKTYQHDAMVWNMLEDKKGNTWLGTEKGLELVLIDTATGRLSFTHHSRFAVNIPLGLRMWSIIEDAQNRLWIGTTDQGLTCYDPLSKKFTSYTQQDGLPGNSVSSLEITKKNKLWISTTNGIGVMDLDTKKITSYSEEDGIISNDFNFKASAITSSGQLFWGTKMGVMSFFADSIETNDTKGKLVATGMSIMGKYASVTDSVTLLQDANMLTIKFALLEYSHARHYYRYRLNGFNDEWNYTTDKNPSATYTNLPPGNYTLQVNAAVAPGEWLNQTKNIFVYVKPAFWQTNWFIASCILLALALIVLIPYSRIKKIIRREKEKQQLNQKISELELSALQSQMNPHFIFNAIHSIQHFIIKNDELNANEYLTKFANLMRLFLESSKRKFIPLSEELEILRLYTDLEQLRFEDQFEVIIKTDDRVDINKTEIPSMLLQPFVENAIIHGLNYKKEKGLLLISFSEQDKALLCVIEDNGIGREASKKLKQQKHTSHGIELILDRVNSYNNLHGSPLCRISIKDKINRDGQSTGTRVEIIIDYT